MFNMNIYLGEVYFNCCVVKWQRCDMPRMIWKHAVPDLFCINWVTSSTDLTRTDQCKLSAGICVLYLIFDKNDLFNHYVSLLYDKKYWTEIIITMCDVNISNTLINSAHCARYPLTQVDFSYNG